MSGMTMQRQRRESVAPSARPYGGGGHTLGIGGGRPRRARGPLNMGERLQNINLHKMPQTGAIFWPRRLPASGDKALGVLGRPSLNGHLREQSRGISLSVERSRRAPPLGLG